MSIRFQSHVFTNQVSEVTGLQEALDLVIQDEHHSSPSASEDVGKGSLEESTTTLLLGNLTPAIYRVFVDDVFAPGLHHHSSPDGVERVRDDARNVGDDLGDDKVQKDVSLVGVHQSSDRIVSAEICRPIDNDALYRYAEATVQTEKAI